jgi:hypothetical protein
VRRVLAQAAVRAGQWARITTELIPRPWRWSGRSDQDRVAAVRSTLQRAYTLAPIAEGGWRRETDDPDKLLDEAPHDLAGGANSGRPGLNSPSQIANPTSPADWATGALSGCGRPDIRRRHSRYRSGGYLPQPSRSNHRCLQSALHGFNTPQAAGFLASLRERGELERPDVPGSQPPSLTNEVTDRHQAAADELSDLEHSAVSAPPLATVYARRIAAEI